LEQKVATGVQRTTRSSPRFMKPAIRSSSSTSRTR